jgi:acyl carrier protein
MTEDAILTALREELGNIAPEMDLAKLDRTADLREALDIDSMDFLNFVIAIHRRLGVDIPELDYPKLATLEGAMAYLKAKLGSSKSLTG